MTGTVRFYRGGEWSALAELKQLFDRYLGTEHYDVAFGLLERLQEVASDADGFLDAAEMWRWFEGRARRIPIFIEGTDPFVVFTVFTVKGDGDLVWALHFGERTGERPAEFFREEWAIIEARLELTGW
jgi:hypothetical protein